ncbi:unnamed protein product, partial [Sphenostylis stenocarpa]
LYRNGNIVPVHVIVEMRQPTVTKPRTLSSVWTKCFSSTDVYELPSTDKYRRLKYLTQIFFFSVTLLVDLLSP